MSLSLEQVLSSLDLIKPLSKDLNGHLAGVIQHQTIKKKAYLEKAGYGFVSNNMYFISSGTLRCFYTKGNREVTGWIFGEGDIVTSVHSFYTRAESYENIQAVEDTEVFYITHRQLEYIYENYPEFNYIARVLTIKYLIQFSLQLHNIRTNSSRERYDLLLKSQPHLLSEIPHKYLASYLGMKPETFSRIHGE
jgi:CRP-like cAMP-binding protein